MSRLLALVGLAAHELWISYRLLLLLTLPLLGGLAVGAIPAGLAGLRAVDGAARWYAISLCASVGIGAAVVSGTLAAERRRGTIAWMVVRAVPRSAVQLAWFIVVGGVMVFGIALGAAAAWLTATERLAETLFLYFFLTSFILDWNSRFLPADFSCLRVSGSVTSFAIKAIRIIARPRFWPSN